jgi:hypothetical protein
MGHAHWLLQYLTSGVQQSRFYPNIIVIHLGTMLTFNKKKHINSKFNTYFIQNEWYLWPWLNLEWMCFLLLKVNIVSMFYNNVPFIHTYFIQNEWYLWLWLNLEWMCFLLLKVNIVSMYYNNVPFIHTYFRYNVDLQQQKTHSF